MNKDFANAGQKKNQFSKYMLFSNNRAFKMISKKWRNKPREKNLP